MCILFFFFVGCGSFSQLNCKDSASRAQYKKSSLFFIAEAPPILFKDSASRFFCSPPILFKDSASRFFARRLSYKEIGSFVRKQLFFL